MIKELKKKGSVTQELVINGMLFKEKVLDYSLQDGVWTFHLDNGSYVVATGSVIFCSDGSLR